MNHGHSFVEFPDILTERLLLRKIERDDAIAIFDYASDSETTRFTTWESPRTIDDTKQFIEFILSQYEAGEASNWGIVLRDNRQFIGTCGFMYWDREKQRAEIGYALAKKFWGRGLVAEAIRQVITFAFERLSVERVIARCHIDNLASERVMQKVGMTFEKLLRKDIFMKGEYVDVKKYAITKVQYKSQYQQFIK